MWNGDSFNIDYSNKYSDSTTQHIYAEKFYEKLRIITNIPHDKSMVKYCGKHSSK